MCALLIIKYSSVHGFTFAPFLFCDTNLKVSEAEPETKGVVEIDVCCRRLTTNCESVYGLGNKIKTVNHIKSVGTVVV